MEIKLPMHTLTYSKEEFQKWKGGERGNCLDSYCSKLQGSYGFGENLVGRHFESLGYKWIHHDYNIFGGNRLGKYPLADEVLLNCLGKEKFDTARIIYKGFKNIEEPDLLIYKPDFSEIRFAESKRLDTRDKLRENQVRGLALIKLLFGCEVDVFEVVEEGKEFTLSTIVWKF